MKFLLNLLCISFEQMTKAEVYKRLTKLGYSTKTGFEFCYKAMKTYAEQTFLLDILQEIDKYTRNGGVLMQVGTTSTAEIVHVVPVVSMIVQDNQGAHKCLGLYASANAASPCRFCTCPLSSMQQPGMEHSPRTTANVLQYSKLALVAKKKSLCLQAYRERRTQAEKDAVEYCVQHCIHAAPVLALFATYEGHEILRTHARNIYNMCPPDEMHTVLGGLMKSWLFFTSTIVEQVAAYDAQMFGMNVVTLDERLKQFPTHCIPAILKKFTFHKGLSGLLESVTGSAENHTTSSLGGLSQQKYPHLILQLLLAIGIKGDILPTGTTWCRRHINWNSMNESVKPMCVTEVVLTAGFALLDLHFNLKRTCFSNTDLQELDDVIVNSQFHILRMYGLRQLLLQSTKQYTGIKMHVTSHFPSCIALYGPPFMFDMVRFDHLHIISAKEKFKSTSRRYSAVAEYMLSKVTRTMYYVQKLYVMLVNLKKCAGLPALVLYLTLLVIITWGG